MDLLEDIPLEQQEMLLHKIADKVVKIGMVAPAIFFLEIHKPFNFIASQLMLVLEPAARVMIPVVFPIARLAFDFADYHAFVMMMERRANVEKLIQKIELLNEEYKMQGKESKKPEVKNKNNDG